MKYSAILNQGGDCPSLDGCPVSTPHEGRLMFSADNKQLGDVGAVLTASDGVTLTEAENEREIKG